MSQTNQPIYPSLLVPHDYDFLQVIESVSGRTAAKTAYRAYDEAVINWLKKRFVVLGKSIPIIPAPPQNAFAGYESLLVELGYQHLCPSNRQDYSSYPLPMVNVVRTGEESRSGSNCYPIRNVALVKNGRKSLHTKYPKPMLFSYSVGLWALSRQDLEWMKQQVELSFSDYRSTILVKLPFETLGTPKQMASIKRESGELVTEFNRDDKTELIHRFVFRLKVDAWMWHDLLEAPTILALEEDLSNDGKEIGSVRTEFVPDRTVSGKTTMPS